MQGILVCENFARGCEINQFRKACEIPFGLRKFGKRLRNSPSISQGLRNPPSVSQGLRNSLLVLQGLRNSFLGNSQACEYFARGCKIIECYIPSLILFLAYLIDLEKASKLSQTWIIRVI